jgi:hypothetical protein
MDSRAELPNIEIIWLSLSKKLQEFLINIVENGLEEDFGENYLEVMDIDEFELQLLIRLKILKEETEWVVAEKKMRKQEAYVQELEDPRYLPDHKLRFQDSLQRVQQVYESKRSGKRYRIIDEELLDYIFDKLPKP